MLFRSYSPFLTKSVKPGTCFPLTAALSLDQACLRCLLVTRGHTGLEPHTLQFLRPLVCLEALLRASALAASVPSPVSVLRPYPGLLPQLTHCLISLPVFLPHHQSVCLHLCRQDNLTVGNSDHYTTLLKIPQDLTKLLITAGSSFQGCLSPPLSLPALIHSHSHH